MNIIKELVTTISEASLWSDPISLDRNQYLISEGETETALYFIISGSLRIFMLDENEEHTIRFGYEESIITALDSFVKGGKTSFYIQALKKSSYKSISKIDFNALMNKNSKNKDLWKKLLEAFVIQQMERETDLLTTSPEARYRRVLKRSPQLFQEIPHKYIASYLRMSPETLSRLQKS